MNSHNSKSDTDARKESNRIGTDHEGVRKIRLELVNETELSIAEDYDDGSDPYNSTGQHVIVKRNEVSD